MKKRRVILGIVIACIVLGTSALAYAKQNGSFSEQWGKILAKDNDNKKEKANKESDYKLALKGKYSKNTDKAKNIAEEGEDVLITDNEIKKARDFYKISGDSNEAAQQKAIEYVEQQSALYAQAVKKGYDVTDAEVDAYIEELKKTIATAENKDEAQKVIKSFGSETKYWEYERDLYKKLLPVQNYVKDLEKKFFKNNSAKKNNEELEKEWAKELNKIKEKAVEDQAYETVKDEKDINNKFLKK